MIFDLSLRYFLRYEMMWCRILLSEPMDCDSEPLPITCEDYFCFLCLILMSLLLEMGSQILFILTERVRVIMKSFLHGMMEVEMYWANP